MASVLMLSLLSMTTDPAKAQQDRRCGLMANGKIKSAESCSYTDSNGIFTVKTSNALYRLDANKTPPRLFINGNYVVVGEGAYANSSSRECELFIALSNGREDFNTAYSNYSKALCVLQNN